MSIARYSSSLPLFTQNTNVINNKSIIKVIKKKQQKMVFKTYYAWAIALFISLFPYLFAFSLVEKKQ